MNPMITFTDSASAYIKNLLLKKKSLGLRLSVKKTGCSGYSYAPTIVEQPIATDLVIETPDGLIIYVDAKWLDLLHGLQVDYSEENKSGLKQKRLLFTNTKETGRCGCGESFHID